MISREDIDLLTEEELEALEKRVEKLTAIRQVKNLRGCAAIFHDDQHIGQIRRELQSELHPSVDLEKRREFRMKPVVDSLEGNMLIHPLTTPVIEVNDQVDQVRAAFWSVGLEGLSKFREQPMAIISLGMVPGNHILEQGEWRILTGGWQRTTKNELHSGWVTDMQPTNTRPPLTPEQDRAGLGKFAYQADEVRQPVPEPPRPDTFEKYPGDDNMSWTKANLEKQIT